ncbi:hypothetical protein DPMN_164471 [Dreissena polymorpha]|uniref:Uncharacterized protein n=1 Tax=Dreissena polymorpha TaxID=45954 RepID=A0A9D4IVG0_DREPO|nr:hypothetical protein DPMN_164471 [Dreissena polymorpha]
MVSINIPDLFPPEQNALIHIITICVTTSNINRKKNVCSLSLSREETRSDSRAIADRRETRESDIASLRSLERR